MAIFGGIDSSAHVGQDFDTAGDRDITKLAEDLKILDDKERTTPLTPQELANRVVIINLLKKKMPGHPQLKALRTQVGSSM